MTALWTPSRELWTPRRPSMLRKVTDWVRMATAGQTLLNSSGQRKLNSSGQQLVYDTGSCGTCGCGPVTCPSLFVAAFSGLSTSCINLASIGVTMPASSFSMVGPFTSTWNFTPFWATAGSGACPTCSNLAQVVCYSNIGTSLATITIEIGSTVIFEASVPVVGGVLTPGTYSDTSGYLGGTVGISSGFSIPSSLPSSVSVPTTTFSNVVCGLINSYTEGVTASLTNQFSCSSNTSIIGAQYSSGSIYIMNGTNGSISTGIDGSGTSNWTLTEYQVSAYYSSSTLLGTYTANTPGVSPSTITVSL